MKLHFEDNLDYQKTAIEAVAELFCGQDINRTEFTVSKLLDPTGQLKIAGMEESTLASATAYNFWMTNSWKISKISSLETACALQTHSPAVTLPLRWKPAPVKPMCICVRSLS